ncbi:helix-turn-helix domain-containing protein [Nocardia sp. NPDC003482]
MTAVLDARTEPAPRALLRAIVDEIESDCGPDGSGARGDLTAVARGCLTALARVCANDAIAPDTLLVLERVAAGWAERAAPVAVLHRTVRIAIDRGFEATAPTLEWSSPDAVRRNGSALLDALGALSAAVSRGYAAGTRLAAGPIDTPRDTTERTGRFLVLAMEFAPHPDDRDPGLDARVVARRRAARVRGELGRAVPGAVSATLSGVGGTAIVPRESAAEPVDSWLSALVARLARAAETPITATYSEATGGELDRAGERAHEVLDLALTLGRGPGLHRFEDLACEYQLTRPGLGRTRLRALLDPLRDEPELLETLRAHFAAQDRPEAASRHLGISPSSVRRRLRRVEELTGLPPADPRAAWYLRSGLIALRVRAGSTPPR